MAVLSCCEGTYSPGPPKSLLEFSDVSLGNILHSTGAKEWHCLLALPSRNSVLRISEQIGKFLKYVICLVSFSYSEQLISS